MRSVNPDLKRHKTAISRSNFSKPIRIAIEAGIITKNDQVLDYGCGLGDDARLLNNIGITSSGWDPVHSPDTKLSKSNIVNIGYVLNVIEEPDERVTTLQKAWSLTKDILIVSARLNFDLNQQNNYKSYLDGFVTNKGTFQKFYTQQELRQFVNHTLNLKSIAIAPGVLLAFRNENKREEFESSIYRRRIHFLSARVDCEEIYEKNKKLLMPLIEFYQLRGRTPSSIEIKNYQQLKDRFGSIKKAFSIIRRAYNTDSWFEVQKLRSEDLITYIALSRFDTRPKFSQLPHDLQLDVKAFYSTYKNACSLADDLLYKAGNMSLISKACNEVNCGKITRDGIYLHESALNNLPLLLRIYEGCAHSFIGKVEGANIIKLNRFKPKISYLYYPSFDKDPHPVLQGSMVVSLSEFNVKYYDYSKSNNPPILHRKETFVSNDYPNRKKFEKLTRQEEIHELYNYSHKIGLKKEWDQLLKLKGLIIKGHRLITVN